MTTEQLEEDGRKPASNIRKFSFQFKVDQTYIWFQTPLLTSVSSKESPLSRALGSVRSGVEA